MFSLVLGRSQFKDTNVIAMGKVSIPNSVNAKA